MLTEEEPEINPRQDVLWDALENAITHVQMEWDLTYSDIAGVMDSYLKNLWALQAYGIDEEDLEDDYNQPI